MKIALSVYKDAISTVFDAADQLLIIEPADGGSFRKTPCRLSIGDPAQRATQLKAQGIDVLICGAISRPLEISILSQGIEIHPFVRGTVENIVEAYRDNRLGEANFFLPGCRRRETGSDCRWRGKHCRRK